MEELEEIFERPLENDVFHLHKKCYVSWDDHTDEDAPTVEKLTKCNYWSLAHLTINGNLNSVDAECLNTLISFITDSLKSLYGIFPVPIL